MAITFAFFRRKPMNRAILIAIAAALVVGCSSNSPAPEKQVQANLAKPVDCSTAQADITTLNGEKARTSQEIEDGASSIIPIGAVAHLFGGSETQSLEIGTGEYNKKLDAKIAAIKQQCDIQ
jgi:PBP1b-binding outer membrane lipoprotein LpoB